MKYGKLTYLEIKQKINEDYMLLIPTGCTEQQGPHLSVDFDTWFAEELMDEVSNYVFTKFGVKTLVAPVIPYGTAYEHVNYGTGYVNLPQRVFEDVLFYTLKSFAEQGFKKLILWRGCGGHNIENVISRFNKEYKDKSEALTLQHPFYDVWCEYADPSIPGGHADSFTTSITMYLHPEDVRHYMITNPNSLEPDWGDPNLDFSKYSDTGVIGDPTYSSKELGFKLWNKVVERVGKMLVDIK